MSETNDLGNSIEQRRGLIFVFMAGATIIGLMLAIKMLGINPSAFPVTHFDNVVAVKGAMIKISAQLDSSI